MQPPSIEMEIDPIADLPDYSTINKPKVEAKEDIHNNNDIYKNNNVEEKTFNEIIKQVVELDEIYADAQARLAALSETLDDTDQPTSNPNYQQTIESDSFDDTKTYSSLQLAFKNPVQIIDITEKYEDISPVPEFSPKQPLEEEKLPPLPPKRIRRGQETPSMSKYITDIGCSNQNIHTSSQTLTSTNSIPTNVKTNQELFNTSAPNLTNRYSSLQRPKSHGDLTVPSKNLPPTPCSTLPNPKKRSFFSKLFSRKNKTPNTSREGSAIPSKRNSFSSSKSLQVTTTHLSRTPSNASAHSTATSIHIPLKEPESSNDFNTSTSDANANLDQRDSLKMNLDVDMSLDLTEAEHYALYTAIAPHATQSEFDETSCYYAPVEGGKILTESDILFQLNNSKT